MQEHVSQIQRMKRPKNVSKQAWTYVQQAMTESQSGAQTWVMAADTNKSHLLPSVREHWDAASALLAKASKLKGCL